MPSIPEGNSMTNRKHALVVVASMMLALSACGGGGDAPAETDASPGTSGDASSDPGATADSDIVIGWSQRGISGSDWWKTLVEGGEAEAAKAGASIELLDANGDTVRQNSDVQTLIAKGVDVVIMNPNDPVGVAPSVEALKEAGIPLVVVNSNLDPSLVPDSFCYVAEDQEATGALSGADTAAKAIERFGETGTLKLVAIGGFPGDVISDLRFNGFMEGWNSVVSDYPELETVVLDMKYGSWKPDQALAPVRDVATANPDLNVVFSESDVMHGGIKQGLEQAGMWDQIILGSYDGGMNVVKEMLDNPDGPLQNTASNQPWDQGANAVKMALEAVNGNAGACPDGTLFIETTLVTPDNAETYYKAEDTYVRAAED